MTQMQWDGSELVGLASDLEGVQGRLAPEVRDVVADGGERVAQAARSMAPRRTGALAGSIRATVAGGSGADAAVEIAPSVRYGGYVEHGTAHMAAHPYLGPALEAVSDGVAENVADAAARALLP